MVDKTYNSTISIFVNLKVSHSLIWFWATNADLKVSHSPVLFSCLFKAIGLSIHVQNMWSESQPVNHGSYHCRVLEQCSPFWEWKIRCNDDAAAFTSLSNDLEKEFRLVAVETYAVHSNIFHFFFLSAPSREDNSFCNLSISFWISAFFISLIDSFDIFSLTYG